MKNRAGVYRSSLSGEARYQSFVPSPLPPSPPLILDENMVNLLVAAHRSLASLESISSRLPGMKPLVSLYLRKEALMSSQIEGVQATLEDALDPMPELHANRDVTEVASLIRATEFAINRLKTLPLCNRLIREAHAILMENACGHESAPGEFRRSQNRIGGPGSDLSKASYIPPCPEDMERAMSDLEKYLSRDESREDRLDYLLRAALIHYQFDTIHPFPDGNGRIGRLLITLYLMDNKVLTEPVLYVSGFLKQNRIEYYDRMTEVRRKGNYEQWARFFLTAVRESSQDTISAIDDLSALHEKNVRVIDGLGRARINAGLLFDYLEAHPIIDIGKTAAALGLSYNAVASAAKRLIEAGILAQTENEGRSRKRNRTFAYEEYLNILKKGA